MGAIFIYHWIIHLTVFSTCITMKIHTNIWKHVRKREVTAGRLKQTEKNTDSLVQTVKQIKNIYLCSFYHLQHILFYSDRRKILQYQCTWRSGYIRLLQGLRTRQHLVKKGCSLFQIITTAIYLQDILHRKQDKTFYLCSFCHLHYIPFYSDRHTTLQCQYTWRLGHNHCFRNLNIHQYLQIKRS